MHRLARNLAQPLPHQAQRQLADEELVISKPPPGRSLRVDIGRVARLVQHVETVADRRQALFLSQGQVDPFRQLGKTRQAGVDNLAQRLRRKPRRQRIDRLDQRQALRLVRPDHIIGMHHRGAAVEPVDLAADRHFCVDRQLLFQPRRLSAEEDQRQFAGLVMQEDAIGNVAFAAWRHLVAVDARRDRHDRALRRAGDSRLVAPVDQREGRVEEQVDDPAILQRLAPEQLHQQLGDLRADARKARNGGKQRIENGGAHVAKMR